MTESLQIRVEFPGNRDQGVLTEETLRDTVVKTFLEMGIEPNLVRSELGDIEIQEESPLVVDPGTAALIVATIGVGVELIKLAVDLYKQRKALEEEARKHGQEMVLRQKELERKGQQLESELEKHRAQKSWESVEGRMVDEKDVRAFLDHVLLARLAEQHNLEVSYWRSDLVKPR